jgi:EF hand
LYFCDSFATLLAWAIREAEMGRFVAGVASALLLVAAGLFFWNGQDRGQAAIPQVPAASFGEEFALADIPAVPGAPEKSKEEKRFNRYDKDKNGAISQAEYLASRQKAYAKLDVNGDGVLQFAEYAVKTAQKFAKADGDRSTTLNRTEFASTRPIRKVRAKPDCKPTLRQAPAAASAPSGEEEGEG